ncbi:MAG: Phospholipase C precursor [Pelotomaculum sp. PtaB.Bin013]|uniref:Phospholipase C n=1 Tax=Pelotomaculum isophthalicicum JI TaxID=947010 RepID=A0A9X4H6G8_9FIRM|nr:zinc dependent phospholipase C family protein [Pelotomaculum isophthalicicum]MDF9408873.1 zinc dependent phospholipase C family protein [Pelotomaculum isophthalicicum JI]OPX89234.1 MAG: Phospholipase C precursor [Pelotomaculum sp. PtaB.Bin013]
MTNSSVTAIFNRFICNTTISVSSLALSLQAVNSSTSTHPFINEQGRRILYNDGNKKAAQLFYLFAGQLDSGVVWIDKGLKSACHHYNPNTGSGFWLCPNAADKCTDLFSKAIKLWRREKHALAIFFLGAAVHLVQDVCVPHHASCKIFNGHLDFELWVEKRKSNYQIVSDGTYEISDKPAEWIAENARLAKRYCHLVENNLPGDYHQAVEVLLPRAQRTTAGFFMHFYNTIYNGKGD